MDYFKVFLPKKKEKLEQVYIKLHNYLKKAYKGLKANNVEEVQWWLGDTFIHLCENKEIIDPLIYESILFLKNSLYDATKTILFFHTKEENSAICSIYTLTILVSERKIRKAFHLQCIKKNEIPRKI